MSEKMISENILQFSEMVSQDLELQERLSAAAKDRETFVRCCVELGKEKGYSFSTKEAVEYIELIAAELPDGELSDEELEAVAGGISFSKIVRSVKRNIQAIKWKVTGKRPTEYIS